MAITESVSFVYRDENGALISGAAVKLRGSDDNFATDLYTLAEQEGLPGSYAADIADMPFQKYKTWINGSENKVFGKDNGKWLGNPFTMFALKSVVTQLLADFAALVETVASKMPKAGGNFTGAVNFEQNANYQSEPTADWPDHETTVNPYALASVARLNNALASATGGISYAVTVFVIPGKADNSGLQYDTIKEAVDYLLTLTPAVNKRCCVKVMNNSSSANYISAASGSFQDYIDIAADNPEVMIIPADTNITANMSVVNAAVCFSGTNARITQDISYLNCRIYHFGNLTIKGGETEKTKIIGAAGKTLTFGKNLANDYCELFDVLTKIAPAFTDGESYGGCDDVRFNGKLKIIADPLST